MYDTGFKKRKLPNIRNEEGKIAAVVNGKWKHKINCQNRVHRSNKTGKFITKRQERKPQKMY